MLLVSFQMGSYIPATQSEELESRYSPRAVSSSNER